MMDVSGFVFQRSYYEALRGLDDENRLAVLDAITDYAFTGKTPEGLGPLPFACFTLIKPTLDSSLSRYAACRANGKRGGRPKNQSKTKQKPKQNLNTDKDMDMVGSPPLEGEPYHDF